MTLVSEESPSKEGSQNINRRFYFPSFFNILCAKKKVILFGDIVRVTAFVMLCFELPIKSCAACPLFLIFL